MRREQTEQSDDRPTEKGKRQFRKGVEGSPYPGDGEGEAMPGDGIAAQLRKVTSLHKHCCAEETRLVAVRQKENSRHSQRMDTCVA